MWSTLVICHAVLIHHEMPGELEGLLRQKEEEGHRSMHSMSPSSSSASAFPPGSGMQGLNNGAVALGAGSSNPNAPYTHPIMPPKSFSPLIPAHISPIHTPPLNGTVGGESQAAPSQATQVLWPNWPHDLPSFELLQHL